MNFIIIILRKLRKIQWFCFLYKILKNLAQKKSLILLSLKSPKGFCLLRLLTWGSFYIKVCCPLRNFSKWPSVNYRGFYPLSVFKGFVINAVSSESRSARSLNKVVSGTKGDWFLRGSVKLKSYIDKVRKCTFEILTVNIGCCFNY